MAPKSVLITGCSAEGLGDELARQFHTKGYFVIATARNLDAMKELSALGIKTLQLDVVQEESIKAVKAQVTELTGGTLDILVNNAGVSYPYSAADLSMDQVRSVFEVNVFSAMAMVQQFLPLLMAAGNARIVHLGSLAALIPVPFGAAYNASKAALHSFGDTLRVELAPFGIKVLTIVAGNFTSKLSKPHHRLPAGSIFSPIAEEYRSRRVEHFQDGAMPREVVARNIIAQVTKASPPAWHWDGSNSWMVWFLSTFGGRTAFDKIMSKRFALTELTERRAAEQAKRVA